VLNYDIVMGSNDNGRYIFNITGNIKEIIYPSKAIISFRGKDGKEEKAILLVHKVIVNGNYVDEHKLMSEVMAPGDVVEFDGHIYDKGGVGNSKDRCNYYAMKAWKVNSNKLKAQESLSSNPKSSKSSTINGTGWISEIFPRKGVLTFDNNGRDERVLFLASKLYIFEKRLGTKQSLDQVLSLDDPVQFEASPQDISDNPHRCNWFAQLIWKGRKPFEAESLNNNHHTVSTTGRRGSVGSTGSSESISTEGSSESLSSPPIPREVSMGSSQAEQVVRGRGIIGKILDESTGVIWWILRANHLQSVWFERKHAFLFGVNLEEQDLGEIFGQGDAVSFIARRSRSGPTNWVAQQVHVTDDGPAGAEGQHKSLVQPSLVM